VQDILEKCEIDYKDYKDFEKYKKAKKRLTWEEDTILMNNNYEAPPKNIPRPSPLLVIDDMSHSDIYTTSRQIHLLI
jgi:hypothetical protein